MNPEYDVRELARLGVSQEWELRNWSEELGVTPEELRAAINAVGLRVSAVRRYLNEQKKRK